jgi:hypothetical protein
MIDGAGCISAQEHCGRVKVGVVRESALCETRSVGAIPVLGDHKFTHPENSVQPKFESAALITVLV